MHGRKKYLSYLGYIEGASLLILLGICTPLKWIAGIPEPTKIAGTIHGVLFLMYVYTLLSMPSEDGFSVKTKLIGTICSCLPFGPFWFHSKYLKNLNRGVA